MSEGTSNSKLCLPVSENQDAHYRKSIVLSTNTHFLTREERLGRRGIQSFLPATGTNQLTYSSTVALLRRWFVNE